MNSLKDGLLSVEPTTSLKVISGLAMEKVSSVSTSKKRLSELTKEERYTLHVLAREQMKRKLLADIAVDLTVCQIEGWDYKEYVFCLHSEIDRIVKKIVVLGGEA